MLEKSRENRLRRKAARLGMIIRKSRVRYPHLDNLGGYALIDARRNYVIAGVRWDLGLDEVEGILDEKERELLASD